MPMLQFSRSLLVEKLYCALMSRIRMFWSNPPLTAGSLACSTFGHSICNADLAILPGHSCPICKVGIKSKPIKNYALMQLLESQGKTPTMVKCRPHSLAFEFWCDECSCLCCPKCFLNTHKVTFESPIPSLAGLSVGLELARLTMRG